MWRATSIQVHWLTWYGVYGVFGVYGVDGVYRVYGFYGIYGVCGFCDVYGFLCSGEPFYQTWTLQLPDLRDEWMNCY